MFTDINNKLQQQAEKYLSTENYQKAVDLYEKAIIENPENKSCYWELGLILLLEGREEEAQTTWLLGMADGESEQVDRWTAELVEVLLREANRTTALKELFVAEGIRQHIREIDPTNLNNLLEIVDILITQKTYTGKELAEYEVIDLLQVEPLLEVNSELLLHILKKLLVSYPKHSSSLEFTAVSLEHIQAVEKEVTTVLNSLIPAFYEIAYSYNEVALAKNYAELLLPFVPNSRELKQRISQFCTDLTQYEESIKYAKESYAIADKIEDKVYSNHMIIRAAIAAGGYNQEVREILERQKFLLKEMIATSPEIEVGVAMSLFNTTFFFPYVLEDPAINIQLRSQVSEFCQRNVEQGWKERVEKYSAGFSKKQFLSERPLKIGYLSHCLKRHSVGWIVRWLFEYHNQEKFQIYAYLIGAKNRDDSLQRWYINHVTKAYLYGSVVSSEVAEQIYEDEIDILIDLDSLTLTNSCCIMALKPAPVQATWLGWDASSIPGIDYFLADPYVLPENAQEYYSEKIWRLPQTYVAVNGFEVGVPSLRRDNLGIPNDAVVYLTAQRGPKYNPQMVRLQMKVIKEVPNSYFVMKGFGNEEFLNEMIIEIAEAEGVSGDQIKFTGRVGLEETHRANLAIADVVLDTYPYNGATTTLETLWMCIPIVTKVGQQFAARNSYTMMMNSGITEGIAWTDEEYIDWGIRLGRDENLRKQVSWKLRQSKRTAPLWNAKQFTREMENAYQQMWHIYNG
ncbi:MAG: O-linked N-acetylglucosamine transferase, SPINDLY family protein [Crocosphaera sp.]